MTLADNHTFKGLPNDGSHAPHTDTCTICGYAKAAHKPGRSRQAKARKAVEISFHSDSMSGSDAHAAVNVKVYHVPDVDADDAHRERAWDTAVETFWSNAMFLAHKYGYSGVFGEGRSDGWCVPFYQRAPGGDLYHFSSWPGQGPTWGYPTYPDMDDPKERARFVRFRTAVMKLVEQCKQTYVDVSKTA